MKSFEEWPLGRSLEIGGQSPRESLPNSEQLSHDVCASRLELLRLPLDVLAQLAEKSSRTCPTIIQWSIPSLSAKYQSSLGLKIMFSA